METCSMCRFCRTGGHSALGDRAGPAQHFALKHIVRGWGGIVIHVACVPSCGLRVACVWPAIEWSACGLQSCGLRVACHRVACVWPAMVWSMTIKRLGRPGLVGDPHSPRWPPGGSVEPVWSLPARFEPTEPQMASRRLRGARLGHPGPVRAYRTTDGLQEAPWSQSGASRLGSGL